MLGERRCCDERVRRVSWQERFWVCKSWSTDVQFGIGVDIVDHVAESVSLRARLVERMEILKY